MATHIWPTYRGASSLLSITFLLASIVLAGNVFAQIPWALQRQLTIPTDPAVPVDGEVHFRDLNSDGIRELTFKGDSAVAVYSISGDSLVCFHQYVGSPYPSAFTLGDFDGDGSMDIGAFQLIPTDSGQDIVALFGLDSSREILPESADSIIFVASLTDSNSRTIGGISAADLDHDGTDELYVSVYYEEIVCELYRPPDVTRYDTTFAVRLADAEVLTASKFPVAPEETYDLWEG